MFNRIVFCICMAGVLLTAGWGAWPAAAHERSDGGYYTIYGENGQVVYQTAWGIRVGDEFITEDNARYEIYKVAGDDAWAKRISLAAGGQLGSGQAGVLFATPPLLAQGTGKVAIYHTHSDESYVPSDGTDSKYGDGGVFQVGDAFAQALDAKGMQAIHSLNKHDPHDDMAYERSRRTVTSLLKQQPDAIFDVHRDAVPPQVYATTINGQEVTKVQLVVGKYGPTAKQIEDYALQLKNAADQQHPGLVKGIFFAKGGDYNQDLYPRSMLLEVGSASNDKNQAERGIALFADVIPTVLGKPSAAGGRTGFGTAAAGASGASKSIAWLVGLLVAGVAVFLLVSTGGIREAGAKLKRFGNSEFANFLGPRRKKNRSSEPDKGETDDWPRRK